MRFWNLLIFKELLDGQEDIGALEAELDAKLSQVESCLEDLNLEQSGLVQSIKAIDNLDPEALDADKGIEFFSPEKYFLNKISKCLFQSNIQGWLNRGWGLGGQIMVTKLLLTPHSDFKTFRHPCIKWKGTEFQY